MHPLLSAMLAVNVAIMQVINMVTVQHRVVPTPWAVGMVVLLGLLVLDRGHDASPLQLTISCLYAQLRMSRG